MRLQRQSGMTLIELMVALAIGAFLMIGAITVFMQSRTTFRITESLSRLQENARFAIDSIEPDIRMAQYWGLTSRSYLIQGRRFPTQPHGGIGPSTCSNNWAINLIHSVQGTNNTYGWGCPGLVPVETNSDTLVVRRASEDPVAVLAAGIPYIQSTRSQPGQLFVGTVIPAGFNAATSQTFRLIVNHYYVSRSSTVVGTPSLRVKRLQNNTTMLDEEVIAGVEDMQIQFGIDTDLPGTATALNPNRGSIDRYVNVNDPLVDPTNAGFDPNLATEILAVRIWLRVRAERPEQGFTDTTNYVYADQNVGPFNDAFRRMVVSKTIYLRNARPAI